jgi:hypothetical protein
MIVAVDPDFGSPGTFKPAFVQWLYCESKGSSEDNMKGRADENLSGVTEQQRHPDPY